LKLNQLPYVSDDSEHAYSSIGGWRLRIQIALQVLLAAYGLPDEDRSFYSEALKVTLNIYAACFPYVPTNQVYQ
jgi:hypothetical protein